MFPKECSQEYADLCLWDICYWLVSLVWLHNGLFNQFPINRHVGCSQTFVCSNKLNKQPCAYDFPNLFRCDSHLILRSGVAGQSINELAFLLDIAHSPAPTHIHFFNTLSLTYNSWVWFLCSVLPQSIVILEHHGHSGV